MASPAERATAFLVRSYRSVGNRLGIPVPNSLNAELRRLLEGLDIAQVIDVGAHHGGFGKRLRGPCRYEGKIESFEPSPVSYAALSEASAADPKWTAVNVALGSIDGTLSLNHVNKGGGVYDSLRQLGPDSNSFDSRLIMDGSTAVPVKRLDLIWHPDMAELRSTLLKVDTQGYDLEVLAGAGDLVEELPALLMEVAVRPLYDGAPVIADVLTEMAARGFELTGAFPINRYAQDLRVIEFDCTFVNQRLFG